MTEQTENTNEQTAVADNTNAGSTENTAATTDSGTAQEDGLDAILKEFDDRRAALAAKNAGQSGEQTDSGTTTTEKVDIAAVAKLEKQLNDLQARDQRRDLENVFQDMTNGVEADAIDAEAFLNAMALREPRLNEVYQARASDPKAWNKVYGTLKSEFQKRYGKKVDKQVTESRDAVASAVRSAASAAPQTEVTDKEVRKMSKEEFDNLQRSLGVTPV